MGLKATHSFFLLLAIACFLPSAYAFGAGDIPDFAFLEGKAHRHGDIENILEHIVRWAGSTHGGGGGLLGAVVGAVANAARGGGPKFSKADVKRVYFGNWLRDYSQAMDIAGLTHATADTIILVLSVLGFMTFGYATEEFKLTPERLGVYLPVEHIDNPKGYADQPDPPNKTHPKLRGRLDPAELEVDSRTGMKNYIAREGQQYDTSAAHVRRSLEKAIALARKSGGNDCPDLFEAYRLLGGALHTLEDLLAHSNWIELSLKKLGYNQVFCHVGEDATVQAPGGERVPPLVTGTFGSADFMFSVMGEATDHLSESAISDLSQKINNAKKKDSPIELIKTIINQIPSSGGGDQKKQQEVQKAEEIKKASIDFNPNDYTSEQLQKQLMDILVWRDSTMRDIEGMIEGIPGLDQLMEQFTEAINVYVYTLLEPYLTPILTTVTDALGDGSRAVIDQDDQYEVFENPQASDPSHSMLSKDHFDNALNDPAGKIAKAVVEVAVNKIVAAWSDDSVDVRQTIDEVLKAFHHPYFADGQSDIQRGMNQILRKWVDGLSERDRSEILNRLTKDSVRDGKNKRIGAAEDSVMHSHTVGPKHSGSRPSGGRSGQGGYTGGRTSQQQQSSHQSDGYGQQQQQHYGASGGGNRSQGEQHYGAFGGSTRNTQPETTTYGSGGHRGEEYASSHQSTGGYGGARQEQPAHGSQQRSYETERAGYGGSGTGYGRQDDSRSAGGYGGGSEYTRRDDDNTRGGYGGASVRRDDDDSSRGAYGSSGFVRRDNEDQSRGGQESRGGGYGSGYGGDRDEHRSYGKQEEHHASGGYGVGRQEGYGEKGYGQREGEHRGNYGGHHGRDDDDNQGARRRQDGDEDGTYGVGRMNLGDRSSGYGGSASGTYGSQQHGGGHSRDRDSDEEKKKKKKDKNRDDDSEDEGKRFKEKKRKDSDDERERSHGYSGGNQGYGGGNQGYGRGDSDDEKKKKKHAKKGSYGDDD